MPYITSVERLAKEEGRLETLREAVIDVLQLRFDSVPPVMTEALNRLENSELLRQLLLQAVNIVSLEEFQQLLTRSPL